MQQMTIFVTVVTGGGCGMMYYLMQSEWLKSHFFTHYLNQEELSFHNVVDEILQADCLRKESPVSIFCNRWKSKFPNLLTVFSAFDIFGEFLLIKKNLF